MDDGMLGDEMTLQELGRQLAAMRHDLLEMRQDLLETRHEMQETKQEMLQSRQEIRTGFEALRIDVNTIAAEVATLGGRTAELDRKVTIGFEETHTLLRFGLEARAALREAMGGRIRRDVSQPPQSS